jgi:hypothetical protein
MLLNYMYVSYVMHAPLLVLLDCCELLLSFEF